jgi:hypothetical protein
MTQPINYQPDNAEARHEKSRASAVHETFVDRQAVINLALSDLIESVNNSVVSPEPINEGPVSMSQSELAGHIDTAGTAESAPIQDQAAPAGEYPINLVEARRRAEMVQDMINKGAV